jgi:uncharacterized membrane protein (DUF485 family)
MEEKNTKIGKAEELVLATNHKRFMRKVIVYLVEYLTGSMFVVLAIYLLIFLRTVNFVGEVGLIVLLILDLLAWVALNIYIVRGTIRANKKVNAVEEHFNPYTLL